MRVGFIGSLSQGSTRRPSGKPLIRIAVIGNSARELRMMARCGRGQSPPRMIEMDWGFPVGVMASVRSPGPFAFWGRMNLEPPALEPDAELSSTTTTEEFALEYIECAVLLIRLDQ